MLHISINPQLIYSVLWAVYKGTLVMCLSNAMTYTIFNKKESLQHITWLST